MGPEATLHSDLMMAGGIIALLIAILAFMSAWVENRLSPLGGVLTLIGLCLIGAAQYFHPQGYGLADVPYAFLHLLSHYVF